MEEKLKDLGFSPVIFLKHYLPVESWVQKDAEENVHPKAVTKHCREQSTKRVSSFLTNPWEFKVTWPKGLRSWQRAAFILALEFKKKICPLCILFIIKGGFYTACECIFNWLINFQWAFMFILLTAAVCLENEFHRWSLFIWGRKTGSSHLDAEMLHLTIAINTWGF